MANAYYLIVTGFTVETWSLIWRPGNQVWSLQMDQALGIEKLRTKKIEKIEKIENQKVRIKVKEYL